MVIFNTMTMSMGPMTSTLTPPHAGARDRVFHILIISHCNIL